MEQVRLVYSIVNSVVVLLCFFFISFVDTVTPNMSIIGETAHYYGLLIPLITLICLYGKTKYNKVAIAIVSLIAFWFLGIVYGIINPFSHSYW